MPRVIREETEFDYDELEQMVRERWMWITSRNTLLPIVNVSGGKGMTCNITCFLRISVLRTRLFLQLQCLGTAAILLDHGCTLQSGCRIPLDIKDESLYNFTCSDATGMLTRSAHISWRSLWVTHTSLNAWTASWRTWDVRTNCLLGMTIPLYSAWN